MWWKDAALQRPQACPLQGRQMPPDTALQIVPALMLVKIAAPRLLAWIAWMALLAAQAPSGVQPGLWLAHRSSRPAGPVLLPGGR